MYIQLLNMFYVPSPPLPLFSDTMLRRAWHGVQHRLGWARRAVSSSAEAAYDQAAGLKNSAGQTWDEAMAAAHQTWQAGKEGSRQSWDDAKAAAWRTWSATVSLPQKTTDAAKASGNILRYRGRVGICFL